VAISVLTEASRFGGSLADLRAARAALDAAGLDCPLLRKDFIVDAYQLLEARLNGADATLLIVAALDAAELAQLYAQALDLGLTPLVEVHDGRELEVALALNPILVGVNNRDLRTFEVDLNTSLRLRPLIPPTCAMLAESGVHAPEQMRQLAEAGVDAALIGEALVTAGDPAARLAELLEAGR